MKTPYGLLPGTHRTTHRGLFPCDVVEYIGPSSVRVEWHADREMTVIPTNTLDHLPRTSNAPHGLNAGTFRTFKAGGQCRVVGHVNGTLVQVATLPGGLRWVHPACLTPIQD
jgi:hypothetical protein